MSNTLVAVHVRGARRELVLAEVVRGMARRGFEPVESPESTVRVTLIAQGAWVSLAVEDLDSPDEWARLLARRLEVPVLGAWFWDGEDSLVLTLCEGKSRPSTLSLPGDARRVADGRLAIPLGKLSSLIAGGRARKPGAELLVRTDEATFDEDGRCVHLPRDLGERALGRAFGLERLFIDPIDDEATDGVLHFRPKPSSAIAKRARAEREAEERAKRDDYDGRIYTVGWLAFDARPRDVDRLIASTARAVVEAITPHLGARALLSHSVTVSAEGTSEAPLPPPADGDPAWMAYGRALRDGAFVALDRSEQPVLASAWLVLREGTLVVGWCMRGLKDAGKRRALTSATCGVFDAAADDPRCFGALLTCQRSPLSLTRQPLAYEVLRGTTALAIRPDSFRARARAPGFRVLVPRAAPAVEGALPEGVSQRRTKAGVVLALDSADPHDANPAAMDALEKYLSRAWT